MDNERSECERPILDDVPDDACFAPADDIDAIVQGFPLKQSWGPGPWQDEPDELAWSYGDVACQIVREPAGTLNGYIGLPATHPWYGKADDAITARAHGGINFAGQFGNTTFASKTDSQLWWIGFDTMHGGDLVPAIQVLLRDSNGGEYASCGTYKNIAYVRREVENLARQAIAAMR